MLGGLSDGRMVIIGGRPKQGKSALVGNIVENLAIKGEEPVVIYSLEMSRDVWMERFIFSTSKVPKPEGGKNRWSFKQDEYTRMFNTAEVVRDAPIHIVEAAGMSVDDLCLSMQTFHNKHGVKNFFIDYIQLVRYGDNEYQTVTEVSKRMVQMKQKLKCNIFCVAQLNRGSVEGGKVRKPSMSDLRSSGQLEQDADAIIFVHRPRMYKQDGEDVIILDANRHGEPGDIKAHFNGFNFQWREL
jgi:replicative DNA helicase